jgi:hypothetical protein
MAVFREPTASLQREKRRSLVLGGRLSFKSRRNKLFFFLPSGMAETPAAANPFLLKRNKK